MINKISFLLIFALTLLGNDGEIWLGKTWEFKEKNVLDEFQKKIYHDQGKIVNRFEEYKKEQIKKLKELRADEVKLTKALKDRVFEIDTTYTNKIDIKNVDGEVIYKKGYKFKVAKYITLSCKYIIINGDDEDELKWLEKNNYINNINIKILIANGNFYKLIRRYKQPFFLYSKYIDKRWHLKHTPTIIEQQGDKLLAKEVYIKRGKNEK